MKSTLTRENNHTPPPPFLHSTYMAVGGVCSCGNRSSITANCSLMAAARAHRTPGPSTFFSTAASADAASSWGRAGCSRAAAARALCRARPGPSVWRPTSAGVAAWGIASLCGDGPGMRRVLAHASGGSGDVDVFELRRITPPAKDLGVHVLPVNTQCGEVVNANGQDWVVTSVLYRYRLRGGRYRKVRILMRGHARRLVYKLI